MCRLFAYSGPPRDLRPFLVGDGSFEALACEHASGWGIATWRAGLAHVRKEPVAADDPKSGWREAVDDLAQEPLVLAHVRKASVGRVSLENTHPFAFGRWAFAHNGTVQGLDGRRDEKLATLEPGLRALVRGTTDSELCGALFLDRLRAGAAGEAATPDHAARVLAATAFALRREFPGDAKDVTRTTFMAGDGDFLVAYRWGRGLWTLQADGWAVLASEPVGPEDARWREVRDGEGVVLADGRARVLRRR